MTPQKVKHLKDELKKKSPAINNQYIVSEKKDGWYVYVDFDKFTGWGHCRSSSGREIPSMKHCKKDFEALGNPLTGIRLIMEAVIPETPFHILNGVFNRSKGNCDAEDVVFYLHDIITLDRPNLTAINRYKQLMQLPELARIKVHSNLDITADPNRWDYYFKTVVNNGGEGVILKQANGIYQPSKRNSSLMKIKQEVTLDLLVVAYYSTIGDKGNTAWNMVCRRKSGVEVTVVVAKHLDIASFELESPIGKVAEISAMKELRNGALREPTFKCIREDKTILDLGA